MRKGFALFPLRAGLLLLPPMLRPFPQKTGGETFRSRAILISEKDFLMNRNDHPKGTSGANKGTT